MPGEAKSVKAQRLKNYEKSFTGQSRQEIADLYDSWAAATYDQDMMAVEHRGRYIIRDALRRAGVNDVASTRVLDVASGTGMLAEALWKDGYRQIDALDGSRVMLEKARPKNVYQSYFCNFMEETEGVIGDDTYDVVATLGSIGHGHLETESLRQMFRVTKPGGLICICGVKERWDGNPEYHQRMRGVITELQKSNKIETLEDRTVENYYYFKQWDSGILILLKKL